MLRLLLTNLAGKQPAETARKPVSEDRPATPPRTTLRAPKAARAYPKSVCTSLKDLCEL